MPWPFDDGDNKGSRNGLNSFDKEFEDLSRIMDEMMKGFPNGPGRIGFHRDGSYDSHQRNGDGSRSIKDPRSYYLKDPRHCNERRKSSIVENNMQDQEVSVDSNFQALLQTPSPRPRSNNIQESVSTSWSLVNGKMVKQERREQINGRTRKVSITSTDENGNISTSEYSDEI